MTKTPKRLDEPEGDPNRGEEILERMNKALKKALETKPKTHKDMVKERKTGRGKAKR